jgi:hypothetical protein
VDVGHNARGLVKCAAADEPHVWVSVVAEDRDLVGQAAEDLLLASVVARHVDRLRVAREQLHTVGLDQQVDDERVSGLSLVVQTVTAMREERIGRKPVANRSAGTASRWTLMISSSGT